MWKPDRSLNIPLYQQIADNIEMRISYGEFPPGGLLPSERKLAEQLEVNRSTIVLAYEELRAMGIIESKSGKGTRVSKHKWGAMPKHAPNWNRYVTGGSFLPSLPFLRRIREVLQQDYSLIDMASGELSSDLSPNKEIKIILNEEPFTGHLGYDHPQGYVPLRETLVQFLKQYRDIHTTESSILITSGSQQSLYLITQCLLAPGDAVAIEDPSYCYSLPMFQSAGLRLFRLPVDDSGIHPEDIKALYKKHRIKMIFLNPNFQNPTGTCMNDDRRAKLLDTASSLGIPIVEDDPFSLTAYDGNPPKPLKASDDHSSVIHIGSMSKTIASGLRIGWMVAPSSVVSRLADARLQMDFGLSVVTQHIAAQFLQSSYMDAHLDSLRMNLNFKRDLLINALRKELPDLVEFSSPEGGLHLWCRIIPEVNESRLLEESIRRGIIYVPGSVYGSNADYVRFTFARAKAEEIEPGIQRFAAALHAVLT